MANTIVSVILPSGLTSHVIKLYQADTLVNTSGGDALTAGSNNTTRYTATVTEAVTGDVYAEIENSGGTKIAAFVIYGMADDTNTYPCEEERTITAGTVDANVVEWLGTAAATPATAGYPVVTMKVGTGTGEVNLSSGKAPATIAAGDLATDSITAASMSQAAAEEIADYVWNDDALAHAGVNTFGSVLNLIGSCLSGISSLAEWLGLIAGKQTGDSTARTELRATGAGSGTYDETTDSLEANRDNIGTAGANLTEAGGDGDHLTAINLPNQTMDIVGNITGNLSGSVGSVTGAVGSVTGNVGGNVAGSVGSVTTVSDKTGYALTSGERTSIAAAVWGALCESAVTFKQAIRRILASTSGEEASDSSSTTRKYKSPNESKTRITATISSSRRSSVVYDDDDEV